MAALRVICLLSLLLLLLNTAWPVNAYPHEGLVDDVYSSEKEGVDEDGNVGIRREIGGRKLMAHQDKKIDIKGNGALLVEETLMAWDANYNEEVATNKTSNKGKKKKKSKVVMKNGGSNINTSASVSVSHLTRELSNEAGFVAFNADYHAPRHHPPKNN